ncbi:hypothetical protein IQ244_12285 [Nostoc sp. LEGE 06077]|uniref:hypothetical protein n=1 Tax=Nostoc sp. LEGE 06077 TaxID=915325 RepID=UPI001880C8B8|nr:hypothetical protein [Nostoc sp. LEGE 06077]MBE9207289.1 hypothetical protein [Nostoc sp. LEGE 06077]
MTITHDFSDFPQALYDFAIKQIIWFKILEFDESAYVIREASDIEQQRRLLLENDPYGYWIWWLHFSTGFEALIKAVFLSNKISLIRKNDHLKKGVRGSDKLLTPIAAQVYQFIESTRTSASNNAWLQEELTRLNINHPYEINTGNLGKYKNSLEKLEEKSKISSAERIFLKDAITVLSDIRRNVDAHVFLKSQIGGSINGDLSQLYIPSINILLVAYQR